MKSKLFHIHSIVPRLTHAAFMAILFVSVFHANLLAEEITPPSATAMPAAAVSQQHQPSASMDPFLAGTLGLIPYTSGFYVGPQPGQGLVFTLIDVALSFGFYSAKHTKNGDPENARYFLWAMGANNIVDAVVSTRAAMARGQKTASSLTYLPQGGVQYVFYAAF